MTDFLLPRKLASITQPNIVVCEGYSDAMFICKLLKHLGITTVVVGCPSKEGGHGMGDGAIAKYLVAVRGLIDTKGEILERLLVIADADLDSAKQFERISRALSNAGFSAPTKPFSIESANPKVGVFIIPGEGKLGTLDNLLLEATLQSSPDLTQCVDTFCACASNNISKASDNGKAKMKMSALIGAHCADNPWSSAAGIWSEKHNPVRIDSPVFTPVSEFLIAFSKA